MKLERYLPKSYKKLHGTDRAVALALTGVAIAAGATFLLRRVQGAKQSPGSRVSGAYTEIATKLGMAVGTDLNVTTAQRYLNQIANAALEETGTLDNATMDAIRSFQRGNGIPETGTIDEETGNALQYMAAATSKNPQMKHMANVSPYLVAPPVTYTPSPMPQPVTYAPASMPSIAQPQTNAPTTTPAASQKNYFTQLVAQNPQLGPPFSKTIKMSIKGAQRALNDLTGASLPLTGKLDHATTAALQNFQNEQGQRATGHLDAETANALLYLAGTQNPDHAASYHRLPHAAVVTGVQSTNLYDPRFTYSY